MGRRSRGVEQPASPRIGEELVAEVEEAILRELRGRREPIEFGQLVAAIAGSRDLPRSGEQANATGDLETGVRFVEVSVAVAEAVVRLIGSGFLLPVYGSAEPYLSWPIVTPNSRGSGSAQELKVSVPHLVRLSSAGAEWIEAGTAAIRSADLYLRDLPPTSDRVRACLREAVEAYRRGLPLACVILLGAASEAAWREVGTAIAERLDDEELRLVLDRDGAVAAWQEATYEAAVRARGSAGRADRAIHTGTGLHADYLRFLARFYGELRNYAAHDAVPPLPVDLDVAATVLRQAHDYFAALYRLPEAVVA